MSLSLIIKCKVDKAAAVEAMEEMGKKKSYSDFINLLFFDDKYGHVHTLLDKKALILEVKYPNSVYPTTPKTPQNTNDSTHKNPADTLTSKIKSKDINGFPYILYTIVFEDTNRDGQLNDADKNDLYISDINGKNLKKVGKDIKVLTYELWNS